MKVLVAGATGALGRHVLDRLVADGVEVRALARDRSRMGRDDVEVHVGDVHEPASLEGAADGCDRVFSCVGASVWPIPSMPDTTFERTDHQGNLALLAEAERAGVQRFVYVSVAGASALGELEYVRAHEAVVQALRASDLEVGVVRPTGFFGALEAVLDMARWGIGGVLGDGSARTNPIHEADLADVCVELLSGEPREVEVGGPEVLTRRRIAEIALEATGSARLVVPVPATVARLQAALVEPVHPRIGAILKFLAEVMTRDCVAEPRGTRTLADYYAERAR